MLARFVCGPSASSALWLPSPMCLPPGWPRTPGTFLHLGDRCGEVGRGPDQMVNQSALNLFDESRSQIITRLPCAG
jgi:hypothetical protein